MWKWKLKSRRERKRKLIQMCSFSGLSTLYSLEAWKRRFVTATGHHSHLSMTTQIQEPFPPVQPITSDGTISKCFFNDRNKKEKQIWHVNQRNWGTLDFSISSQRIKRLAVFRREFRRSSNHGLILVCQTPSLTQTPSLFGYLRESCFLSRVIDYISTVSDQPAAMESDFGVFLHTQIKKLWFNAVKWTLRI